MYEKLGVGLRIGSLSYLEGRFRGVKRLIRGLIINNLQILPIAEEKVYIICGAKDSICKYPFGAKIVQKTLHRLLLPRQRDNHLFVNYNGF